MTFRILTSLSCLLAAAHVLRDGRIGEVLLWLGLPALLWWRRPWTHVALGTAMIGAAAIWALTATRIAEARIALGQPWLRMALILGGVGLVALAAAASLLTPAARRAFRWGEAPAGVSVAALLSTFAALMLIELVVDRPMTLLGRFVAGGGRLEAAALAAYAAWLAGAVWDVRTSRRLRPRVWLAFSILFYGQLLLGLAGIDELLMTGTLHVPVPAVIAAGPVYRGGGWFMVILFGTSLLLVGPAWCSWLCYLGGWDNLAATRRKVPAPLPPWRRHARPVILLGVVAAAFILGRAGASPGLAAGLAVGFGLAGVGVMLVWSRRTGSMAHCTAYCPIGYLATRVGRLSPFRLRIDDACSDCMACTRVCRFDALGPDDVRRRRPGEACTLCGDCLSMCVKGRDIGYHFAGLSPTHARAVFITLVVTLHTLCLAVARV
jgi:ferredoxin